MDGRTELEAFVKANVFVGWLFLTIILLGIGKMLFGNFGLSSAVFISIFIGWRIVRYFCIQSLAWKIHQLHGLKKLHAIRHCLINEAETDKELMSLQVKLAKKYCKEVIL